MYVAAFLANLDDSLPTLHLFFFVVIFNDLVVLSATLDA